MLFFQPMQKENSPCWWLSYNVANSLPFMENVFFVLLKEENELVGREPAAVLFPREEEIKGII